MSGNLEHFARRVETDPQFLAAALAVWARGERLDDAALAARLSCEPATLTHLRLCRMPRAEAPFFWTDVEGIAARFGLDPDALAEVVRHGQSLLRLREVARSPGQDTVFLKAARDRPADGPGMPSEGGGL